MNDDYCWICGAPPGAHNMLIHAMRAGMTPAARANADKRAKAAHKAKINRIRREDVYKPPQDLNTPPSYRTWDSTSQRHEKPE